MEKIMKGDIIVIPFPFSDLSRTKRRPAYVAATSIYDDLVLCQITTSLDPDKFSIPIIQTNFSSGSLNRTSLVRPNMIFTADKSIVLYKAGKLVNSKIKEIEYELVKMFTQ
jgi:mRNA interferase MazF